LGIPADWLGRLFERFQRVDRPERAAIRGIGLGLYIARQLVELNGGRIWATSEGVHQGATFHFTLPVAVSLER
jgi:signal transduction histidine kinase